jgi:hypothetical protein
MNVLKMEASKLGRERRERREIERERRKGRRGKRKGEWEGRL